MNSCLSSNLLKILLVEDSEYNLPAFISAFSINGYEVEISHSASAEEALEVLDCDFLTFDALITNHKLPGMSGLELFKKLRSSNKNLPVIMLIPFGSEDTAVDALKAGIDDYIIKDRDQKFLKLLPFVVNSAIRCMAEQKKTLDAMRLMQFSVDQASEMIMWVNSEGQFTYVNKKTCDTLGYTKEELLNKVIWDVDEEYSHEYYIQYWIKMGQIGQDRFETVYWRKDGSRFPVDVSVSQGVFEGNKFNFAFARDISERKQMEEDLQKANEELEVRVTERTEELAMTVNMLQEAVTMLQKEISERIKSEEALMQSQEALNNSSKEMYDLYNHAPCGYHSLDENGTIVRINNTELNWLGYNRDEIVGVKKFTDLITPEGVKTFNDTFPKLKSEGLVNDIEQVMVRKDGTLLPVVLNATAIYDNNGKYLMSRSTVFDMTELKLTEEKLRQKDRMMMQQSRQAAMGEMIGNIAHQWRQPLNTLGLLIQQLPCFYDTPDFTREFVNSNTDESMKLIEHMSQTIDDFRNFFRPDREKSNFDVKKLIRKTISLIEASFISQNISVTTNLEDNLFVAGYPNEFSQVLLTILNNAREAYAGRNIKKAVVTISSFKENDRVVVTVSDNAGGIPEQIIDKIFDPYFTTKGSGGGTGIGLYMSKTIIQNSMNGSLTARNTDKGAEFRIEI